MYAFTVAHRAIPLGTKVRITNLKNNKHIVASINDRGPFIHSRVIDLSYACAKALDITGVGKVKIEY